MTLGLENYFMFRLMPGIILLPEEDGKKCSISMCNQMVTSEISFDKTQVKLFPYFTSIPFDYLLISWVTNYAHNRQGLTCLSRRELQALKSLKHTDWLKFTFF